MTQDFYKNAQALLEEFQKRELQYLNEEKKWNKMISEKDYSLLLQEYLQKMDEREKESEAAYRNIMKQMEELDRQTDMMSFKLEKLSVLGTNAKSTDLFNCSFNPTGLSSTPYIGPSVSMENIVLKPYQTQNLICAATQTESKVLCENCNSEIYASNKVQHSMHEFANDSSETNFHQAELDNLRNMCQSNAFVSSTSNINEKNISQQQAFTSKPDENSFTSAFVTKDLVDESHTNEVMRDATVIKEVRTENTLKVREETLKNIVPSVTETMPNEVTDLTKFVDVTGISPVNVPKTILQKGGEKTKSNEFEDSVDISKSDDGSMSMYHEFDFLEDETPAASKGKSRQNIEAAVRISEQSVEGTIPELKTKVEGVSISEKSNLDVSQEKCDSSSSVTGPPSIHSDVLSVGSDSDSFQEGGGTLKTSAAYQALLENTVIPPKSKKVQLSDSDSDDEIERELATAVRKSSQSLSKELVQSVVEKSPPTDQDSKRNPKSTKALVKNKPHSNLSKNTRKAIGLKTSSESEVELVVQSSEKKTEEDSDEFDFYD